MKELSTSASAQLEATAADRAKLVAPISDSNWTGTRRNAVCGDTRPLPCLCQVSILSFEARYACPVLAFAAIGGSIRVDDRRLVECYRRH